MSEPKPFASLSSSLLARKGTAKPAMRPQGFAANHEDLGWNDMGLEAMAANPRPVPVGPVSLASSVPSPALRQQAELARGLDVEQPEEQEDEAFAPAPAAEPAVPVVRLPRGARGKAAFTLRLDPERHLRLRLACAVKHLSAQQIVTEALDQLLNNLPEIEDLAAHLPSPGSAKR